VNFLAFACGLDMNESSDRSKTISVDTSSSAIGGCALGPHWLAKLNQDEISNSQENVIFRCYL
jgi:hypothetical protein